MNIYYILGIVGLAVALAGSVQPQATQPQATQPQTTQSAPKAEWNFDKDEVGKTPAGWRVAETKGTGKTGKWTVAADEFAPSRPNVLKVETAADDGTYNLMIAENTSFKDLFLRVRVKADGGKVDQGGGLIWRCKDENNYYICRINPLERNFRVYKVEGGKRTQLAGEALETKTGQWYEVWAVMIGDRIECYADGRKVLEATDDTFKDAGMVGLWTKADASSSFDYMAVYAPPVGDKLGGIEK